MNRTPCYLISCGILPDIPIEVTSGSKNLKKYSGGTIVYV